MTLWLLRKTLTKKAVSNLNSTLTGGFFSRVPYIDSSMSNIKYTAVLFTNISDNELAPQFTGHVTVPVSRIDEMIELLRTCKVFQDKGEDTVRLPLSFWTAQGKAPLAFKGQSSFQVLEGTPVTQKMTIVLDKAPTLENIMF